MDNKKKLNTVFKNNDDSGTFKSPNNVVDDVFTM